MPGRATAAAVAAAAALAVYANSLYGEFVFDDSRAIVNNQDVKPGTSLRSLLVNDFWGTPLSDEGSHKSYRPLTVLTFKLNYAVGGLDPFGYHLLNVALHGVVTATFTALVDRLLYEGSSHGRWPALLAGLIFAVHPVHAEAVASVVGRAELLAALFFLLSLASYDAYMRCIVDAARSRGARGSSTPRRLLPTGEESQRSVTRRRNEPSSWWCSAWWLFVCIVSATVAMLCKETGITALAVCLAWHLIQDFSHSQSAGSVLNLLQVRLRCLAATRGPAVVALSCLLLLVLRAWIMDFRAPEFAPADNPAAHANSTVTRALTFLYLPAAQGAMLLFPSLLSFDWSMDAVPLVESLCDLRLLGAAAFYACILALLRASCCGSRGSTQRPPHSSAVNGRTALGVLPRSKGSSFCDSAADRGHAAGHDIGHEVDCRCRDARRSEVCRGKLAGARLLPLLRHTHAYLMGHGVHESEEDADDAHGHLTSAHWSSRSHSSASVYDCLHSNDCDDDLESSSSNASSTGNSSGASNSSSNSSRSDSCSTNCGNTCSRLRDCLDTDAAETDYAARYRRSPNRSVLLGLAMLILSYLPASNLFFYVGFVIAERALYIPSMGYCLAVAEGAVLLSSRLCWPLPVRPRPRRGGRGSNGDSSSSSNNRPSSRSVPFRASAVPSQLSVVLPSLTIVIMLVAFAARTMVRNSDWSSEEYLYRSGTSTNPAKAWANLANVLKSRGDLAAAEQAYVLALQHRANMADVHYNYGLLLQERRMYNEAETEYRAALSFRPRLTPAYLNLGILKAAAGAFADAELLYQRCADLDTSGQRDPRMHASTKVSCLYNLGRLHLQRGQYSQAIDVFLEAVQRLPDYHPSHSLYNLLGEAYFNSGQFDRAEHWYKEALRAKRDHAPAHMTMARLYARKGLSDEASRMFKRALELRPDDVNALQHYAYFLLETGKGAESETLWLRSAELAADSFEALMNSGDALRRLGKDSSAQQVFERAVATFPQMASGHANLGAMLHAHGKYRLAERSYIEALRLNPADVVTQDNIRKLRSLLSSDLYFSKSSAAGSVT